MMRDHVPPDLDFRILRSQLRQAEQPGHPQTVPGFIPSCSSSSDITLTIDLHSAQEA